MTLKGSTKEFPLETLLRLLHDTKKTGELTVRGRGGEGALGLAEGRVVTAMFAGETKPIPALGAVFKIGEAEFEFLPWDDAPPANLEGELEDNLKHAEEYANWLANVREVIPHDGVRFRLSERAADQGAVTFTPDRWRVVMAVNTQPDVTTLAANLHIDRDEALTTLAGLVRDGVIETIEAPGPPPPAASPQAPQQAQEWRTPAAIEEPAPPAAKESEGDWSAGLVKEAAAAQPAAEPAPAAPAEQAPAWSAPADRAEAASEPAPPSEPTAPPATEWIAPVESAPQWAPSEPAPPAQATPPPEQEKAPSDWGPTVREVVAQPEAARPADPNDWGPMPPPEPPTPSVLDAIPQDWGPPQPAAPEPVDDRLAALSGIFDTPAKPAGDQWSGGSGSSDRTPPAQQQTPAPEPALGDWGTPASAQPAPGDWGTPPGAQPAQEQEEDPRLAAMKMPMPPQAPAASEPKAAAVPNEWAPPPSMGEATSAQKKKGGLGGLFRQREAAPEPAARTAAQPERAASTRAGQLAAFCNALLGEFNSGRYGKGHVDDRIAGLLMRVDEQADPIDRPLPVVDDRLDVQALERVSMPEQQAVPYLALLVSTIYTDAEKAFGRDKAKRGYKAAQSVFGGDTSALSGPDLAGKLPKV